MRRTLLAIGFVVLASMLFAPHVGPWRLDIWGDKWGSYWWTYYPLFVEHIGYSYNTHRMVSDVLSSSFFAQTAFLAVLAAVLVNLRQKKSR